MIWSFVLEREIKNYHSLEKLSCKLLLILKGFRGTTSPRVGVIFYQKSPIPKSCGTPPQLVIVSVLSCLQWLFVWIINFFLMVVLERCELTLQVQKCLTINDLHCAFTLYDGYSSNNQYKTFKYTYFKRRCLNFSHFWQNDNNSFLF